MKRTLATVTAVLLSIAASVAGAQDAEAPPEEAAAEAPPAEAEAPAEEAPPEQQAVTTQAVAAPPARPQGYARPRPAPPIMVVVLPGERVAEDVTAAAREALVAQITPLAGGRAVHGLGAAPMIAALAGCTDDACIGAQLASAGAQAGVLLKLTRRGRQLAATLEIRDPVSGTSRTEAPVTGDLPSDAATIGAELAALSAQLASAMPSAPSGAPTLLITTTADGALVTVDGEDIGQSPVGPIEIADGEHEVIVRLTGFESFRTTTRIAPGARARVDATLRSMGGEGSSSGDVFGGGDSGGDDDLLGQWWFWTIIGGGAALLIGLAIGIGVAVGSDSGTQDPQTPMGIPLPPITGGM